MAMTLEVFRVMHGSTRPYISYNGIRARANPAAMGTRGISPCNSTRERNLEIIHKALKTCFSHRMAVGSTREPYTLPALQANHAGSISGRKDDIKVQFKSRSYTHT